MTNLQMPGNPRYQPENLQQYFGHDNFARYIGEVEIASLEVMAEVGFMPKHIAHQLTDEVKSKILDITTTQMDAAEKITKHDIRAWVSEAKKVTPPELGLWIHIMLTSYDVVDTARALMFRRAHVQVVEPLVAETVDAMRHLLFRHAQSVQIGRTHGQHAIPITVGFWLAGILDRILYNINSANANAGLLVGKISGAVGGYNAQVGLGLSEKCGQESFEVRVLKKLGLTPAPISTQIVPPEPLANYLFSCLLLSSNFGQLGEDCRHLMRSEIGEVQESFSNGQSGSSTMAHKRNPINFENMLGMYLRSKSEFGKVLDTLISEHQRDLTGSSALRDFSIVVINLVNQLNTILRKDDGGEPFIKRLTVNNERCRMNFDQNKFVIMAEPLYIALQLFGYEGDAHELVNHILVPYSQAHRIPLHISVAETLADNKLLGMVWRNIPKEIRLMLESPEEYTGLAVEKTEEIANKAGEYLSSR